MQVTQIKTKCIVHESAKILRRRYARGGIEDLSRMTGIPPRTLYRLRNDDSKCNPNARTIQTLYEYLTDTPLVA